MHLAWKDTVSIQLGQVEAGPLTLAQADAALQVDRILSQPDIRRSAYPANNR